MVGRYAHLDGVLVGEEVDDLERVRDDADGEELLAVVAAVHHHAVIAVACGAYGQHFLLQKADSLRTCQPTARRWASEPS